MKTNYTTIQKRILEQNETEIYRAISGIRHRANAFEYMLIIKILWEQRRYLQHVFNQINKNNG